MKIPASALKSIQSAVLAMLPYEKPFEPESKEAKTLIEISTLMKDKLDDFDDVSGLMWFMARKIDDCSLRQESLRDFYTALSEIVDYYREDP